MTGPVLHVVVHGTPAPQGSKRHVGHDVLQLLVANRERLSA